MLAKDINKDSIINNDGLSYKEIMGDHLLSMTLNNLKQTHEAVQGKQIVEFQRYSS